MFQFWAHVFVLSQVFTFEPNVSILNHFFSFEPNVSVLNSYGRVITESVVFSALVNFEPFVSTLNQFVNSKLSMSFLNHFNMEDNFNEQPLRFDVKRPFLLGMGGGGWALFRTYSIDVYSSTFAIYIQ